jgi:VWFA-related protein
LGPSYEVSLLAFSHHLDLYVPPTTDRSRLIQGLDRLTAAGGSALYDAIYAAVRLGRERERVVVMVFTDGEDNLSWLDASQVIATAEASNALLEIISISPPVRPLAQMPSTRRSDVPPEGDHVRILRRVAEVTGGHHWETESPMNLEATFLRVFERLKTRYLLKYEPQGAIRTGYHRIQVRLLRRRGRVHARPGYFVTQEGAVDSPPE